MAIRSTRDHREIRRWAQVHGGTPVFVRGAGARLAIDLPGGGPHLGLRPVDWERWFAVFDTERMAFVYDEGAGTAFYDLITPPMVAPG